MLPAAMKGTLWCLHGAVGMADDWRGLRAPGWSVKRVDLWRYLECCPMPMADFGKALNAEAAAGGGSQMGDGKLPPFGPPSSRVLVGYSMGARLALHALIDSGPWDAAVLIAPHPGLESEAERAARRAGDAAWAGRALSGDWREFLAAWEGQGILKAERGTRNAEWRLADRDSLVNRRREVARSFVDWSLGAQEPLWDRLGGIRCPVLWCVGERDTKFRALAERAAELCPQAECWIAPAAGHRVPWDAPEAFRDKLGEFLERAAP